MKCIDWLLGGRIKSALVPGPSRSEWEKTTYKRAAKWQNKDVHLWQMLQHSWSKTKMGLCKRWLRIICCNFVKRPMNIPPLLHIFWGSESLPVFHKHQWEQKIVCSCSSICTPHVDSVATQQLEFGSHHTIERWYSNSPVLDNNWWS